MASEKNNSIEISEKHVIHEKEINQLSEFIRFYINLRFFLGIQNDLIKELCFMPVFFIFTSFEINFADVLV